MRYQWSAKRPLNAQNQTYYIAPVYFEWNVFDLYGRKVNAVIRANEAVFDGGDLFSTGVLPDVGYEIASAERLAHLDDRSVDYVFTDPPFGSNIFYSDITSVPTLNRTNSTGYLAGSRASDVGFG